MPTTWAHIRFDSSAMFDMDSPINPERLFSAVEFTANSMIAVTEQVENRMSPILNTRRKMVASHPTFSMTSRSGTWYIVRKNRIVWVRPSGSLMWPHALFNQLARGAYLCGGDGFGAVSGSIGQVLGGLQMRSSHTGMDNATHPHREGKAARVLQHPCSPCRGDCVTRARVHTVRVCV